MIDCWIDLIRCLGNISWSMCLVSVLYIYTATEGSCALPNRDTCRVQRDAVYSKSSKFNHGITSCNNNVISCFLLIFIVPVLNINSCFLLILNGKVLVCVLVFLKTFFYLYIIACCIYYTLCDFVHFVLFLGGGRKSSQLNATMSRYFSCTFFSK